MGLKQDAVWHRQFERYLRVVVIVRRCRITEKDCIRCKEDPITIAQWGRDQRKLQHKLQQLKIRHPDRYWRLLIALGPDFWKDPPSFLIEDYLADR